MSHDVLLMGHCNCFNSSTAIDYYSFIFVGSNEVKHIDR